MNRDEIVAALTALGRRLERRGLVADMYVVGGAAIALAFSALEAADAYLGGRLDVAARFFVEELFSPPA